MQQWVAVLIVFLLLSSCSGQPPVPVPPSASPLPSIAPSETPRPSSLVIPSPTVSPSLQPTVTPLPIATPINFPTPTPIPTISSYRVEVVAGSGQQGLDDGPALQATFHTPRQPCLDKRDGTIYIPDHHMLRKLTPDGQVITVAGSQEAGYKDGPALDARFDFVRTCVVEANGDVLIGDRGNRRIRRLTSAGEVSTFLGTGEDKKQDGPQAEVSFTSFIIDMELLQNGELYIMDEYYLRLWKKGQLITLNSRQGGVSSGSFGTGDGTIGMGVLGLPAWMTADSENHLYFADESYKSVRKLSPWGNLSSIVATSSAPNDWLFTFFTRPTGIAFDPVRQCLFVIGDGGGTIHVSNLEGKMQIIAGTTLMKNSSLIFQRVGDDSLLVGKDHHLYVIDEGNRQVKRIVLPPPPQEIVTLTQTVP